MLTLSAHFLSLRDLRKLQIRKTITMLPKVTRGVSGLLAVSGGRRRAEVTDRQVSAFQEAD